MSEQGTVVTTSLCRIVWGNPEIPKDRTTRDGQKVLDRTTGLPVKQWSFGVAIPKADFNAALAPVFYQEALSIFPNGQIPPDFAYKYKDGDDPNPVWNQGKAGTPLNQREGHAGHYILTVSTELQMPKIVQFVNGAYMQVQPGLIKTGDYVMLELNIKGHAGQSPGLYINPTLVLLCYQGPAIVGTYDADPTKSFGAAPPQFAPPPGAVAIGAPPAAGGMPGMPGQMPQQPQYQPPLAQPGAGMPQQPPMAGMPAGAGPAGAPPSYPMQPGQPGAHAAPMSPSNMPPPATDFIPGGQMPQQGYQQPQGTPGNMPGQMPPR